MAEKMFMRVDEVAQSLDVSIPYAYKLIRQFNEELKKKGCITIAGVVSIQVCKITPIKMDQAADKKAS